MKCPRRHWPGPRWNGRAMVYLQEGGQGGIFSNQNVNEIFFLKKHRKIRRIRAEKMNNINAKQFIIDPSRGEFPAPLRPAGRGWTHGHPGMGGGAFYCTPEPHRLLLCPSWPLSRGPGPCWPTPGLGGGSSCQATIHLPGAAPKLWAGFNPPPHAQAPPCVATPLVLVQQEGGKSMGPGQNMTHGSPQSTAVLAQSGGGGAMGKGGGAGYGEVARPLRKAPVETAPPGG